MPEQLSTLVRHQAQDLGSPKVFGLPVYRFILIKCINWFAKVVGGLKKWALPSVQPSAVLPVGRAIDSKRLSEVCSLELLVCRLLASMPVRCSSVATNVSCKTAAPVARWNDRRLSSSPLAVATTPCGYLRLIFGELYSGSPLHALRPPTGCPLRKSLEER